MPRVVEVVDDLVAARAARPRTSRSPVTASRDAGDAPHLGEQLARAQQRLRGHAGVEGALAADQVLLHDRHAQAGRRRAARRRPRRRARRRGRPRRIRARSRRNLLEARPAESRKCHCLLFARACGSFGRMATADAVLKPDLGSRRKHFIFTEEHDQLRESIRAFVHEGARAARRGVGGDDLPRLGLPAHGRARLPRALVPGGVRRPGRRLLLQPRAGRGDRRGATRAASRWASRCTPTWPPRRCYLFGTEEQKQDYLVPAIKGEKISCLGITEPDAGSDVAGIKTRAVRDGDEWVINGSKTYITNGHRADFIVLVTKTDPDAGYDGFTLFLVDMDSPGVIREKKLEKLGMHASDTALLAFQDVRVPEDGAARPGGQGLLPHHVGAPGRAADRRGGLRRGRAAVLRPHAPVRHRAQRVRPPDRQVPGDPAQVRRHGDEDRGRPPDGLHDGLALPERRVPRARDLDGQALRVADRRARSPTSASRSTAAPAT